MIRITKFWKSFSSNITRCTGKQTRARKLHPIKPKLQENLCVPSQTQVNTLCWSANQDLSLMKRGYAVLGKKKVKTSVGDRSTRTGMSVATNDCCHLVFPFISLVRRRRSAHITKRATPRLKGGRGGKRNTRSLSPLCLSVSSFFLYL